MYNLSLLVLTKNEEDKIERMLHSIISMVKEIIVIDMGSTDKTKEIIKSIVPKAKIYFEPFTNFSDLLNKGISYCTCKWILFLDADEEILWDDYYLFEDLLNQDTYDSWKIPRHHWKDLGRKEEYKAPHWYPNYTPKLFLNNGIIKYTGYISPDFIGAKKTGLVENGLHIQHFNLVYNTPEKHAAKQKLYEELIKKQEEDKNKIIFPLDLTILTLTHDDAAIYIEHMLQSVVGLAKEYVYINTGEKKLCEPKIKRYFPNAKIFNEPFTDFGSLANIGISKCTSKWILCLDTDEWINPEEKYLLPELLNQTTYDMYCIPRKHWHNLELNADNRGWWVRAFPDYQARLFLNNNKIKYTGKVHCGRIGAESVCRLENGLYIYHFSFVYRPYEEVIKVDALYKRLMAEGKKEEEERRKKK